MQGTPKKRSRRRTLIGCGLLLRAWCCYPSKSNFGCKEKMKIFNIFKKSNPTQTYVDGSTDETGYVCGFCGRFNPMNFKYCPNCGTERFSNLSASFAPITPVVPKKIINSQENSQEDRITSYLKNLNLLHLAEKQFQITIQLENGEKIAISLLGRQNSNDALQYLRSNGLISFGNNYIFTNWPTAAPCIGPDCQHISACVCELDQENTYFLKSIETTAVKVF